MQLEFFRQHFYEKDVFAYLEKRNLKYQNRKNVEQQLQRKNVLTLAYFPQWLSGFIEREGCFCVNKNNRPSFSIGQKHDLYLIEAIQHFLGNTSKIISKKENFYCIHVYRRAVFMILSLHFEKFPLLGEK